MFLGGELGTCPWEHQSGKKDYLTGNEIHRVGGGGYGYKWEIIDKNVHCQSQKATTREREKERVSVLRGHDLIFSGGQGEGKIRRPV